MPAHHDEQAVRVTAIQQVLYRYCRAMDRMDAPLTLSCFEPDAGMSYGKLYQGDPAGFVAWLWPVHAAMVGHTHMLSNVLVGPDGDDPQRAVSEAYVTVTLRFTSGAEQFDIVGKGRYLDRWAQRDGDWRIVDRRYVSDLRSVVPVDSRDLSGVMSPDAPSFEGPVSSRDQNDPSYSFSGLVPQSKRSGG